jgi:hypothetical protein
LPRYRSSWTWPSAPARVVLIEGQDGIGKTALPHRFVTGCRIGRVLTAKGEEAEAALTSA